MMMMNGNSYHQHRNYSEGLLNGFSNGVSGSSSNGYTTILTSSSMNSSPSPSHPSSSCNGLNYIEHRVSKMDTLAGVAIKYGVEVADIRRMNGLVTDLQMFALEILRIPLPGRHPPSPILPNGSATNGEHTPPHQPHGDVLNSLQSLKLKLPRKVSPAMSTLQGYYGLSPPPKNSPSLEGTEMSVYKTSRALYLEEERPRNTKESPATDPGFRRQRKSRSLVSLENGDIESGEFGEANEADKSIRRRQKTDTDPSSQTQETILKEDNSRGFLGRIGKNLALRLKLGNSATPAGDFINDVFISLRKSSSTSSLHESESVAASIWPTSNWSLKSDAIDLIARPIFDGLPKPMIARRNKAALD